MSDIAAQFYNAWIGVMDDCPRPQKLLCTWHVDRAITTELRKKIGDQPTEGEVYKMFRTVLEQTNETLFDECLQGFLNRLSLSAKTTSFKTYFERDWVPRKQQWAYCFRVGLGINTNMFVEAFHHVFKYNYLKGKTNKRMDNLLLNLMKFVRDKTFDRLIKLTKGKVTMRLNMIHERHLRSLTIPTSTVTAEGPTTWGVLGEDGRSVYNVSKLLETCSDKHNCQLQCQECCICVHMYVCNCPDSLITTTICKHIHLVRRCSISSQSENHAHQWCEQGTDQGETKGKTHRAQQGKEQIAETFAEMEFLKECLRNAPNNDGEMDREKRKRSLKAKLLTIVNDIEGCENDNALQQLEKNINSANSLFISIREHEHGNKYLPIPKPNIPHNKNIEPQKRFFSTKKKPRKSNVRLVKPSKEEKIQITKNWQGNVDQSSTDEQFSTGDTDKEELQEMMNWFCHDKKLRVKDLQHSGRKLLVEDMVELSEVPSIPGEALEADLTVLRGFFTDAAWKMVLVLENELKKAWLCRSCQQSRYMDMIQCDSCLHWFDWECANVLEEPDEWFCDTCANSLIPPKKSPKLHSEN